MEEFTLDVRRLHPEEREALARMVGHINRRERLLWFVVSGLVVIMGFCGGVLLGSSGKEKEAVRCGHAEYVNGEFRWLSKSSR